MSFLLQEQPAPAEADVQRFLKPGETLDQLYLRSVREVQKWRKRRRWTLGISWGSLIFMIIAALVMPYIGLGQAVPLFVFLLVIGTMLGLLAGILMRPSRRNALNSLFQANDVRAVGPLLEATQMMMPDVTLKAAQALLRLLPHLRAEHAELLTPLQRHYLRSLIVDSSANSGDNPILSAMGGAVGALNVVPTIPFRTFFSLFGANKFLGCQSTALSIAVLQALAYIGDARDLELIRHIAANPIQQAALQAQVQLEDRVKGISERATHGLH